jgi:hypothetical protein
VGEQRHQRLHAVQQRETGEAAKEHGAIGGVVEGFHREFILGLPCITVQYIFEALLIAFKYYGIASPALLRGRR